VSKKFSRRLFLELTGASAVAWHLVGCDDKKKTPVADGGPDAGGCEYDLPPAWEDATHVKYGTVSTTICPYCGCGCGLLVTVNEGEVVNIDGDPDHPVNRGALCSKGASLYQLNRVSGATNPYRLVKPRYRAAGSAEWQEVEWADAISAIAAKVKATRDATFVATDGSGRTVNRTEGIACLGGAALDNEECYLLSKAMRALGLVYLEHQARI
jgi:formate dehydrogenase major subunit